MLKNKIYILTLFLISIVTSLVAQNKLLVSNHDKKFDSLKFSVSKRFFNAPFETKKDAILLAKMAKTRVQKIESLHLLGYVYDLTGNVDSAKYCLENRLKLTSKYYANDKRHFQAVIDYTNWGMDYIDGGVLTELLTNTISKLDKQKNKKELGLMYLLLGDVFFRENQLEKASSYFDKSFQLLEGKLSKVDYYERKGNLSLAKNNYNEAKNNFNKAIELLDNKTVFVHANFLKQLGYTHYKMNNFVEARKNFNEALTLQNKYKYLNLKSSTFLYLSYLEKAENNLVNEKKALDSAKTFYEGDILVLKDINLAYSNYFSRTKDLQKENFYLNEFKKNLDSINRQQEKNNILKVESSFQLKESKKELLLKNKILEKESKLKQLYFFIAIIAFFLAIIIFWIFYRKMITQKKLNKNQYLLHEEQLKLMMENQRTEIIKEKIKAKIEERGKLSLELHDGIANEISALKLSISDEKLLTKSEIDSVVSKIDKLYNEVRNLSHELDPDNIADVEFSQLVNNLCLITEKNGVKTKKSIFISKKIDDLDDTILLNLYRILQEAINNTLKHAEATEIQIDVMENNNELYMSVIDNGKGFTTNTSKPGIGLKNIEKRVNALDGNYEIVNNSKGTTITIRIPMSSPKFKDVEIQKQAELLYP